MKKFLLAAGLIALGPASAMAADLPARTYSKAPAIVSPAYNWTGFYVGVMGGYGWSDSINVAGFTAGTNDIKGGFVGGTIGYNWQGAGSPFVVGIEVDGAWSDINFSETLLGETFEERIRSFGSVTGRLGYAVDAALFYVKGGYAWANNRLSVTDVGTLFSESRFHSGWTIGGGLEYGFAQNWSAKAEYMFASYANEDYLTAFVPGGIGFGFDVHTVKGGINYRFGGPVAARY
ncbi:outer membrane protein [Bradyrhizobium sp. URHD0069]|uniref:outer membrane protein n=1 Tax=Bradyrhizobium sp. URHD0069 TaxID=1380355 RepID=UPI00049784C3|nr:outer membrane protein [Bradyrhizobium sp. URHD0069]